MTSPDHASRVIANTPAEEVLAQFLPDGRWVAYQTNESGRFEVVVQPFPVDGGTVATNRPQYAVARDGRFLINQPVADTTASPITLILNWNPDAKQ